ncbi:helix-turn-helix domain-containing protein [Saccharothrix sp. HUAS TT1]|uniref:helix-turn-helix domain-containing protein n=1 Tax=unclassified Saccharothrix TaxID=2593673 RepID=UPI00345C1A9A
MTEPPDRASTAYRREFGEVLRRLRKARGLGIGEVAGGVGWSSAKLSKLESGLRGTDEWEVGVLLGAVGADRGTRDYVRGLMSPDRRAFVRSVEGTIDTLTGVRSQERLALSMRCFEPFVVPALLQTEDYMRAVFHAEVGFGESHTRAVWARLNRQDAWRYKETASAFYVAENALATVVGGPVVMHAQMLWLHGVSQHADAVVRIVPSSAGLPVFTSRAVEMHFSGAADPVVYLELDGITTFVDDPPVVRAYQQRFAVLGEVSLDPDASRELIARQADHWRERIE